MPTFKIQSQCYYWIGLMFPVDMKEPFLQIYFISNYLQQRETRTSIFLNLNPSLVGDLQTLLNKIKCY